jgi:HSP20 family molecular chaperone IbpA
MTYLPDVDIYEAGDEIHLRANMPGVDQHSVEVTVENNVLTVEGQAHIDEPQGHELAGQEYAVGKYRRDFTLSNDVDAGAVKARMQHGVLELTLPKREEVKKKQIKIES